MWNKLAQNSGLIGLRKIHDNEILDSFLLTTKTEYFVNLKRYISDSVLKNNTNIHSTVETNTVKSNSPCGCIVRLTTADIIEISFTSVLQDITCTLSASLLNKELSGNYVNIDYLLSLIRFSNNPQLKYAFTKILEEEAVDFNLELGIDTLCLFIPELYSQLLLPVITQRSF
ncbi:hypothetical protein BDF21DRAFT_397169 [Thamnidium elegans]|nr:hypothetical protein BDF21DRAFT_397169 [Thamnidium elegans]